MARKLAKNVVVGRTWYGPAHGNAGDVPDDVAEQITNPRAWEGGSPSRPSRSDSKQAWVDYAVTQGVNRDDADAMTKDALVTQFSDKD